jgi:uncharacterized protein (DUF4415 family)
MDITSRLRKRAQEDQECADNSRAVVDAFAEQMRLFEVHDGAHNVYAVRMAVDHKNSMNRDTRYAADLREAADLIDRLRADVKTWQDISERNTRRLNEVEGRAL